MNRYTLGQYLLRHPRCFADITGSLNTLRFEVYSVFQNKRTVHEYPKIRDVVQNARIWSARLGQVVSWYNVPQINEDQEVMRRSTVRVERCNRCKVEGGGAPIFPDHSFESYTAYQQLMFAVALSTTLSLESQMRWRSLPRGQLFDRVVFDKTGTLTQGGSHAVTRHIFSVTTTQYSSRRQSRLWREKLIIPSLDLWYRTATKVRAYSERGLWS